jgi:uncharacterized protein YxjI
METSLTPSAAASVAVFAKPSKLSVRQRKRWLEILTSLDARNTYVVYDEAGDPVFNVQEQGSGFGSLMKRLFLSSFRPFTSHVENLSSGLHLLTLRRPFRFIFHRLEVSDAQGNFIGAIQRKWTWFRRKYIVEGIHGQEVATLFGPFFRPWTFKVLVPGSKNEIGLIQKKWSGLLKEMFTQADNFWVSYDNVSDPSLRALLFTATVLIDVVHFERKG